MQTYRSTSEAQTERIAAAFARTLRGGEVLLLEGDLGAGKTAFVRGLARGLGVRERITSPTFVLMRTHQAKSRKPRAGSNRMDAIRTIGSRRPAIGSFVHVDAYRIHDPRALEALGLFEYMGERDTVVAIEWGERVRKMLHHVRIRTIRITGGQTLDARTIAVYAAR